MTNMQTSLNQDACYAALLAHDARFDGRFFVGVSSTGIYCRVVCTAKMPKRENCTFYATAAMAEKHGYRPCLRCRPELAPGFAQVDSISRYAAQAAERIADGALSEISVGAMADEMGISERHLRRVVEEEFGVTPVELAQTHRLLLAKRLLTDTKLPVTEIAFASGFASLRRFNTLFKERYRMNPTDLRRAGDARAADTITLELPYHAPLDWASLSAFLAGRVVVGVETLQEGRYIRAVRVGDKTGWIAVQPHPARETMQVEMSTSLAPVLLTVQKQVRRVFDLSADLIAIESVLGELAHAHPGLRLPGCFDGYEMTVRAILGQQISVKAATTLAGRFAARFGDLIETPFAGVTHLPPRAERVAQADESEIVALGIVGARTRGILALSRAVAAGELSLDPTADLTETMVKLKALPQFGEWTAQYVAMRALSHPDAFPHTDLGIYKALNESNPRRVLETAEQWRPYRAYAALHLWKSLEQKG